MTAASVAEPATEGDGNLTAARQAWSDALDPATSALLDDDAAVFIHQSLSTPCLDVLESASGAELITASGRRILDFHGNSVHQVGHGHPRVVAAIKAQLDALPFSPRRFTNKPSITLAQRLAAVTPGDLGKVLFAPGGTSAIGMALKLARYATGRHKTLSMWDSFHGASLDAISVGGEMLFRRGVGPLLPGAEHVPPFDQVARFFGAGEEGFARLADYIAYVLATEGDIGALIAEPVRWTRIVAPPADFWPRVKASCARHGALLIFDEIPSGLGRTGTMFACEQFGAVPDILVLGKGLGGGIMPLAAIVVRPDLDVTPEGAVGHYTHEKSPVAAAAALATLDIIDDERLVERACALGEFSLERLRWIADTTGCLTEVRGLGLFFGAEVAGDEAGEATLRAEAILYAALERGLSFKIGGGNVLTLCPPLNIPEEQLERAFDIFEAAVRSAA